MGLEKVSPLDADAEGKELTPFPEEDHVVLEVVKSTSSVMPFLDEHAKTAPKCDEEVAAEVAVSHEGNAEVLEVRSAEAVDEARTVRVASTDTGHNNARKLWSTAGKSRLVRGHFSASARHHLEGNEVGLSGTIGEARENKTQKLKTWEAARQKFKQGKTTDIAQIVDCMAPKSKGSAAGSPSRIQVMISYSRVDSEFAHRLRRALGEKDLDVWIDVEAIQKGVDWRESIKAGIENAHVCVFCMSRASLDSTVCNWEVDHMIKHRKKILPIVAAGDFDWDEVRVDLARINFIFFTDPKDDGGGGGDDASFDRSLRNLCEAIKTDFQYIQLHTRFSCMAIEWDAYDRCDGLTLKGKNLQLAEDFIEKSEHQEQKPSELMEDFFAESKLHELAEERKRQILAAMLEVREEDLELDVGPYRKVLRKVVNTPLFQRAIVVLILVDFLLGLASLIVDAAANDDSMRIHVLPVALTLLAIFQVEILVQWYAIGFWEFFRHVGFVLDLVVVSTSLSLEIYVACSHNVLTGSQVLTVLRAWRLSRLLSIAKLALQQQVLQLEAEMTVKHRELAKTKEVIKSLSEELQVAERHMFAARHRAAAGKEWTTGLLPWYQKPLIPEAIRALVEDKPVDHNSSQEVVSNAEAEDEVDKEEAFYQQLQDEGAGGWYTAVVAKSKTS